MDTIETQALQALARGYCSDENSSKVLDSVLIQAMAVEVLKIFPYNDVLALERQNAELAEKVKELEGKLCLIQPLYDTGSKPLIEKLEAENAELKEENRRLEIIADRVFHPSRYGGSEG